MMKTTLFCSLISMLFIASSAFVLEHNALQHRDNKMRLNLKQTVSNQVSFSKKAATPNHPAPTPNEDSYDENAFHRRIVHFEHHRKDDEGEDDGKKHSKKPYGGWNHRQFARAIDP